MLVAWSVLSIPDPVRFRAPGSVSFEAAVPGTYTLWHEHRTVFEGRSWNGEPKLPGGMSFRLRAPSGEQLPMELSGSSTWNTGGTERVSVGQFELSETGRYELAVEGDMGPAVLSIGRSILGAVLAAIAGAILLAVLGVGGGLALALWTFAKRLDSHKTAAPPAGAHAIDAEKPLRELATVVYALQAASFLVGLTLVAGVIVNYLKRDEVAGTWLESHFRWQIRTFWWMLAWGVLGFATAVVLVGFLVLAAAAVWFIHRIARGWIALAEGKPVG